MNTVQKKNNITKKQVQELLEKNKEKLGFEEKNFKKILKSMKSNTITRNMRSIFYKECIKKISSEKIEIDGSFRQLVFEERVSIEILHTAGFNYSFIGAFIGKDRSTIQREIGNNSIEIWNINSTKSPYKSKEQENIIYYSAEKAQKKKEKNKLNSRKKLKLEKNPKLKKIVVELIKEKKNDYSPDVIAGLSKLGKLKGAETTICANTIYRAVKLRIDGMKISDLPHGRAYYKKDSTDVHTATKEVSERKKDISIEVMPQEIKDKKVDTHFEGDSIIGTAKGRHETLITLVNTASQFAFIMRAENKTAQATVNVMDRLENEVPNISEIMETLLLDNGVEFSKFEEMMKSNKTEGKRVQIYFAHPYASYERGCNENKNRLIRRTFRKGKLVESLSDEDILNIARRINNMPRKALGYRTPLEVLEEKLIARNVNTEFLDVYRIKKPKCLVA